jgi:hypothetical protein
MSVSGTQKVHASKKSRPWLPGNVTIIIIMLPNQAIASTPGNVTRDTSVNASVSLQHSVLLAYTVAGGSQPCTQLDKLCVYNCRHWQPQLQQL